LTALEFIVKTQVGSPFNNLDLRVFGGTYIGGSGGRTDRFVAAEYFMFSDNLAILPLVNRAIHPGPLSNRHSILDVTLVLVMIKTVMLMQVVIGPYQSQLLVLVGARLNHRGFLLGYRNHLFGLPLLELCLQMVNPVHIFLLLCLEMVHLVHVLLFDYG
jgi:hypothetical protein